MTDYVDITCPHCNQVCAEIPLTLIKTQKATNCLKHLRVCSEFTGTVETAPAKKQKAGEPTNADLLDQLKQMREENRGMTRRIAHGLGLGDPLPDNETLLVHKVNASKQKELQLLKDEVNASKQVELNDVQRQVERANQRRRC